MNKIIWQIPTGEVHIGFIAADHYVVPVKSFKTWAEFINHVQAGQHELIMYYMRAVEWIEQAFSTSQIASKHSNVGAAVQATYKGSPYRNQS